MQNNLSLEIRNLSIILGSQDGGNPIVDNINLELERGKCLGIVGESGSGKTITALSILKLLPPSLKMSGGNIFFHSSEGPVTELSILDEKTIRPIRGRKISIIFQEPMTCLNPVFTCGNQVAEVMRLYHHFTGAELKNKTLSLFRQVHLPEPDVIYRKFPHELSGGQRQRVMIAMALTGNPEILIADEPTTALDVTVQKAILELLKEIQKTYHLSILFISHDLGVIGSIADGVIIMRNGRIVEQGPVNKILQHPEHPYTRGLIACRPSPGIRRERLMTIQDFIRDKENILDTGRIPKIIQESFFKPSYSDPPILSVSNITTRFVKRRTLLGVARQYIDAVNNITLSVYRGETLGLIGESGSGKSTLGRTILKLINASSGIVYYKGKATGSFNKKELKNYHKNVQMIFQDPYSSLNPRIRIGDAITEVMHVHGLHCNRKTRKGKAIEILNQVGLNEEHFYRFPHEFSGGQRQRIGIARALATEPELLICDESVSALDVSVQAQVLNLLNDLKKLYQLTYIFISHDLAVVRYMSDRIIVIRDGLVVEEGPAERIYKSPESEYTRLLIDSLPG